MRNPVGEEIGDITIGYAVTDVATSHERVTYHTLASGMPEEQSEVYLSSSLIYIGDKG